MRKSKTTDGLTVRAIAGSHVVLLGIHMPKAKTEGLLGFAIERTDHTENEKFFLKGLRTFEETDPGLAAGTPLSTREHPIQDFKWSDFTAKPNHEYTYRVVALTGKPKNLSEAQSVEVKVTTEADDKGEHAVFFNRGVAGSQAYSRKFQNKSPDDVPDRKAFKWLSRGLVEALLGFIGQAKNGTFGLRAAVYEFAQPEVLEAFAAARAAGADVQIVYDAKHNASPPKKPVDDPRVRNEKAIGDAGLDEAVTSRETNPSYIAHNKFIVLLKDGNPIETWTGSVNITAGGIYGHSNVGHIVRNEDVAAKFLAYWEALAKDPEARELRTTNEDLTPLPPGPPAKGTIAVFSPRRSLKALEWYRDRMLQATGGVFFTAAFGVNDLFAKVLDEDVPFLRYVILDNAARDSDAQQVELIRRDSDNRVAIGEVLLDGVLDNWLKEKLARDANGRPLNGHVKYIHTKYMLIDALSEDPIVITGSANFSDASTKSNDENMLVIRGDTRVADIYVGEFMRLFTHFAFRDVAASNPDAIKRHLSDNDSWVAPFFQAGTAKLKERQLFSGKNE